MTEYICTYPDDKDSWCHYCCKDCSDRWSCMSLCRIFIQNFKAECKFRKAKESEEEGMSRMGVYNETCGFVPDDDAPHKLCINCKSHCVWAGKDGEPEHKKCLVGYTPITNADRIRAMSDEELMLWLYAYADGSGKTREQWIEWLKKEVDDGT